ncbi:electron transport complex protein RnfE [Pseudomonas asplenii]|uniref:Electron transport complex protein RnfE n=1 Tax=Pseudomonas asplenii TaxID=53407 RepID=A0A1H6N2Y1_9PSED|nr:Rnf-Nqr domain containing protein [Pseudomonas fuscovaginae]SEI06617.1 electron transport complex protein RnfE [Pseudomonas fuscovaginae]
MNRNTLLAPLMLTPLLGASDSLVKAVSLWLAGLLVVGLYGASSRALGPKLGTVMAWPAQIVLAAGSASLVSLGLQAWSWELQQALGFYLALLSVQCLALEHWGFFRKGGLRENIRLFTSFGALLTCLGLLREVLADGTLFAHLQWWTGSAAPGPLRFFAAESGLRLAGLLPGGFILLGLLLAGKQAWTLRSTSHRVLQRK